MKKIFALFLAFTLLCVTACNTKPSVGTGGDGSTAPEAPENSGNWQDDLTDQFIYRRAALVSLIELPSRIVFNPITGKIPYTC